MARLFKNGIVGRYWWIPLFTGLIAVGLGIWCLCSPTSSIPVLAYTFAACLIVAGIVNFCFSFQVSKFYSGWGWSLALGILELISGIWLWFMPEAVISSAFLYIIGIWILVVAVNGIAEACAMSVFSWGWILWALILLFCTIGFAIIFISNPLLSGIMEWIWLGISLITFGIYRISFAFFIK